MGESGICEGRRVRERSLLVAVVASLITYKRRASAISLLASG